MTIALCSRMSEAQSYLRQSTPNSQLLFAGRGLTDRPGFGFGTLAQLELNSFTFHQVRCSFGSGYALFQGK